ncbi:hypothetical protein PENSPDRAFT_693254 [Peniophora sp. CONT]|nr:hypothetical protein PENSPDRAFT_693254 [Peniophora sp. CONT]
MSPRASFSEGTHTEEDVSITSSPNSFLQRRDGMFRCQYCLRRGWMSFEQMLHHEDNADHVREVRKRDRVDDGSDNDSDAEGFGRALNADDFRSSPISAPLETASLASFDTSDTLPPPLEPLLCRHTHNDSLQSASQPIAPVGIHGPAIPGDRSNEIYNNFGGAHWQSHSEQHLPPFDDVHAPSGSERLGVEADSDELGLLSLLDFERDDHPNISADVGEHDASDPVKEANAWWPWQSKQECLTDLLSAFPRVVFSDSELDIVSWYTQKLGVRNLPAAKTLRRHREVILKLAGALLREVTGVHGNHFTCLDLAELIKHEVTNPQLRPSKSRSGYWIDDESELNIPLSSFVKSFPMFEEDYASDGFPNPHNVNGHYRPSERASKKGTYQLPNPWRVRAQGWRILSLPIWLYCDDTSGNVSKKWNKHNSFLFTIAGLDPDFALHPSNIHFLSTSNLAPCYTRSAICAGGLAAWDCKFDEEVLVLPWVLAFFGDNPMQSEMASHVGLTGKQFCCACKAQGGGGQKPSIEDEVRRVTDFLKVGKTRELSKTLKALRTQFEDVQKNKMFGVIYDEFVTEAQKLRASNTAKGLPKDTGVAAIFARLRRGRSFQELINPIFQLQGFNVHTDTPVEILHVVLLGIIKYFWREAVSRQTADGKKTLRARLRSLDPRSLGLSSQLQANILVNYAGSLTGRDFRIIAQVAPAFLYGLVPRPVYNAWLCVAQLAPMVFQPRIGNLETYLVCLECAIDALLLAALRWNIDWFNKPKFHILLHLPTHIRRFGPPRKASNPPSEEIAQAMNFMHAARHLVCSGFVEGPSGRRTAGSEVIALLRDPLFARLMGLTEDIEIEEPVAATRNTKRIAWSTTGSAQASLLGDINVPEPSAIVQVLPHVSLPNHDKLHVGCFALYREDGAHHLGQVIELVASMRHVAAVLVERWQMGVQQEPYRMPSIYRRQDTLQSMVVVSPKEVLCVVHVFHNCARQRCEMSRTRPKTQERQKTDLFDDKYRHNHNPDDLVLNIAQFRSSALILTLYKQPIEVRSAAYRQAAIRTAVDDHSAGRQVPRPADNKKRKGAQSEADQTAKRARTDGEDRENEPEA